MDEKVLLAVGLPVCGMLPEHGSIEMENRIIKFPVEFYNFWLQGLNMPRKSDFSNYSKSIVDNMINEGFFIECNDHDGQYTFNKIRNLALYRQGIQKEINEEKIIFAIGDGKIEILKNDIFLNIWQSCNGDNATDIYNKYFASNMPQEYFGMGVILLYAQGLLFFSSVV